jgi:ATP-binding cassette subfamily B protein
MKSVLKFLLPYWALLILAVGMLFIQANCDLALPDYMSRIVDIGILRGGVDSPERASQAAVDPAGVQMNYLVRVGGLMLLITLVGAAATILVGLVSARVGSGFARDLRAAVFKRVESFSNRELDKFSTASLITRTTNDIMQLQMLVTMGLRMIAYAPIVGIGGIIRAIGKSSSMWWVIALAVGILIVIVLIVFNIAIPKFKLMQKLVDRLNLVSRERLSGIMVIRAFCRQDREEQRFDEANRKLAENMLFVNRVMVLLMPVMTLIMSGVSLLITWFGAHYVASGALQVGDMMAFMQYAIQIVFSFLMLSFVFIMLPRAAVSADRIAEVLATRSSVIDPDQAESFGRSFTGSIEFRSVSFRYPGAEEDVLKDVSFTVPPGQTTAIIGTTGSGKSSLVNLVPRLYDVTSGSVLVDGIDVRKLPQTVLRDKIGFVPQKAVLFSGTIESNLRYADEGASTEAIDSALRISQAAEFVTADPQGIHAPVSQGGANVSGGQRQRLAIARALVKKPPIYIFDDSFSALDLKTDQALRRALKEETAGATVIMVTQRVATIKNADRIVVLDEGRVVGIGRHAELLDNCEAYREIATSQLTEEELL